MSDINKIVAAILTAGRQPTLSNQPRGMDDWLVEYQGWLTALQEADQAEKDQRHAQNMDLLQQLSDET